jgi:hypothetical protein
MKILTRKKHFYGNCQGADVYSLPKDSFKDILLTVRFYARFPMYILIYFISLKSESVLMSVLYCSFPTICSNFI